jgi:hypothetical protein
MHATCPTHLTSLVLLTRIISDEDWKPWHSSLHSFLQSPVTFAIIDPNIFLSTLFSITLSLFYNNRPSFAPTKNRQTLSHSWQTTNKSFTTIQKLGKC